MLYSICNVHGVFLFSGILTGDIDAIFVSCVLHSICNVNGVFLFFGILTGGIDAVFKVASADLMFVALAGQFTLAGFAIRAVLVVTPALKSVLN